MRFAEWVKTEGWSWAAAAREIGAANATAARRLAHGTLPKPVQISRIYLRSGGQVTPNDFYDLPALPGGIDAKEAA
jgi:hypothetical protein